MPELGYNTPMTCIVGIVDDEFTYIGGERAASDNDSIISMKTPKIYTKNGWVYGYAGTIGIGQLMDFIDIKEDVDNIHTYIRLEIVEQLKKAIESFSSTPDEHDTSWLIGREGRLFELNAEDWSVIEINESSIGGGSQIALGSLYSTQNKDPMDRIALALGASIMYSPHCKGPIDILFS